MSHSHFNVIIMIYFPVLSRYSHVTHTPPDMANLSLWAAFVDPISAKKTHISTQCLTNVGPPSTTLDQHRSDIEHMCRICWAAPLSSPGPCSFPADLSHHILSRTEPGSTSARTCIPHHRGIHWMTALSAPGRSIMSLIYCPTALPVNTKHVYNICTLLDQHRRRWVAIVHMLCKCLCFPGFGTNLKDSNCLLHELLPFYSAEKPI